MNDDSTDLCPTCGAKTDGQWRADRTQISDGFHTFAELYRERSALAAALAKRVLMEELKTGVPRGTFAGIRHDDQPGIDGYRTVLYIELPTGQVSWHFNDAGATDFLDGIPRYLGTYDGHTTPEKCRRIETLPVPY